jgi:hypothetical protein
MATAALTVLKIVSILLTAAVGVYAFSWSLSRTGRLRGMDEEQQCSSSFHP